MNPRFSIVIPAHNQASRMSATLACLEAQVFDADRFECIFVDDASSDGTAEALQLWKPRFATSVLRNPRNVGRSTTRNRGWQAAKGEIIVFLDGDMLPHPHLLAAYDEHFASGETDVVSGRRLHFDLTQPASAETAAIAALSGGMDGEARSSRRSSEIGALLDKAALGQLPNSTQRQLELEMGQVCERYPLSLTRGLSLITSNVALSRAALSRTQGFCPFFARSQDTELGIRLARGGARFRYAPDARAVHLYDGRRDHVRLDASLRLLVHRHPYLAVVAWYVWSTGHAALPSLLGIARAEAASAMGDIGLLEMAEGFGFPKSFPIESDEFAECYATDASGRDRWKRHLARAEAAGVVYSRLGARCFFDHDLLVSWLKEEGAFEIQDSSRSSSSSLSTTAPSVARPQRVWAGHYQVRIPIECIPRERPVFVNLALPIGSDSQAVSVTRCSPKELLTHRKRDMIVGFPLSFSDTDEIVELSYEFECRPSCGDPRNMNAREALALRRPHWHSLASRSEPPRSQDLNPSFPLWTRPDLQRLLRLILPERSGSEKSRIHTIMSWLLAELGRSTVAASSYVAAQTGIGPEAQVTSLFVNLCQLAGVPARERCVATLDDFTPDGFTRLVSYRSPFAEIVAEVWLSESGWTRVDLRQRRGVTVATQPHCGALALADFEAQEVEASIFCTRLPTLASHDTEGWAPVATGLRVTHQLTASIVHERAS